MKHFSIPTDPFVLDEVCYTVLVISFYVPGKQGFQYFLAKDDENQAASSPSKEINRFILQDKYNTNSHLYRTSKCQRLTTGKSQITFFGKHSINF